ncbi:recombinase family protein [Agromyces bauzanensis]
MQPQGSGTRAAIYLRQSLDVQEGIERQRERCVKLIEARGWRVGPEYADNDTSASKRRGTGTAWARMLDDIGTAFDVIVAVDLDRLLRSTADLLELTNRGARVVTVDGEIDLSTADGEFRATMLAGIARFEVRRKGERQQRANQQRADKGKPPSGVRLTGYTTAGDVIKDEAKAVHDVFERFAAGESLKGLAALLDASGVPTRRGGRWNPSSVRTMLQNPRYAGRAVYRGAPTGKPGTWEPIVSEALFDVAQARLNDPRRVTNREGTDRKYLGSGLYVCGVCGGKLRTNGPRYWCPVGGHVTRSIKHIDAWVTEVIRQRLRRSDAVSAVFPANDSAAAAIDAEAKQLRERLGLIESDYDAGLIDGRRYATATEKVHAELRRLEGERGRLLAGSAVGSLLSSKDPVAAFDAASLATRRALVDALAVVRVDPGIRGRKGFDEASVRIEPKDVTHTG